LESRVIAGHRTLRFLRNTAAEGCYPVFLAFHFAHSAIFRGYPSGAQGPGTRKIILALAGGLDNILVKFETLTSFSYGTDF
jgi:hypothetical protein